MNFAIIRSTKFNNIWIDGKIEVRCYYTIKIQTEMSLLMRKENDYK